jgi:hypothetical protein
MSPGDPFPLKIFDKADQNGLTIKEMSGLI